MDTYIKVAISMASANVYCPAPELASELPAAYLIPHWYAAYTCANHEKQVAANLCERGVENFLPLYEAVHRWTDRRVHVQLPLFPGYVFVRLALRDRLSVLRVPSVVRLVGFGGSLPAAMPEHDIESLRHGLSGALCAQPHPYLTAGRRVRIKGGPLAGMEGVLLRRKGSYRVVLSLDLIMRSIAVDIDVGSLQL